MKFSSIHTTTAALSALVVKSALADPVATCLDQSGCLSVTYEVFQGQNLRQDEWAYAFSRSVPTYEGNCHCGQDDPDCDNDCQWEICFTVDTARGECIKGGAPISHVCTKDDQNECGLVDWGNGQKTENVVTEKYCIVVPGGKTAEFIMKDGNDSGGCGAGADGNPVTVDVIFGGATGDEAQCAGALAGPAVAVCGDVDTSDLNDAGKTCSGGGNIAKECIWKVDVPDCHCDAPSVDPPETSDPTSDPTEGAVPDSEPEPTPTKNPTKSPSAAPTLAVVQEEQPPTGGGSWGDPHFQTWQGEVYDFHGACDLVLVKSKNAFGFEAHVRTKIKHDWSYVAGVAVKIGDDVLEVGGNREYYVNGVEGADVLRENLPATIGGFRASMRIYDTDAETAFDKFTIDLGEIGEVIIKVFGEFLAISINYGVNTDMWEGSVGLMGEFGTGNLLGRDGKSIFKDTNLFGVEWQVNDDQTPLFQRPEGPQFPSMCNLPRGKANVKDHRRLAGEGGTVSYADAKKACQSVPLALRESCIYDATTTGNLEMAAMGLD